MTTDLDRKRSQGTISRWLVAAFVAPVACSVVAWGAGFGMGTICTNDGSGRSLSTPPCDVVSRGVRLIVAVEAVVFALSIASAWLPRRTREVAIILVVISLGGLVAGLAIAASYS